MASSSTTTSDEKSSYMYDVFVSFRGKDLRLSFVDHLFDAFQRSGIIVFKDDKDIVVGERISDELPKAIQHSKFHIVIFSKRYADSYWCLNELIQILECRKPGDPTVYAIFYHVTPSQVRDQKGPVRKAFAKRSKNEAAGRWRAAMAEAATLKGWELAKTGDGHEVQFIEKIVRTISQKPYFANPSVDDNLVGVASPVEKLLLSLQVGVDDVRMIGITGLGGVGKTTLAGVVFNRIANQLDGKSFVENVRERSQHPRGFRDMQKQILTSVFGDQSIAVPCDFEGRSMMMRRMPSIKVLVVLDDVNNLNQLEALAEPRWFRAGSRIIITSRDRQVLLAHGVQSHNIHDVSTLSDEDAIRLLSRYAFRTERPAQGYEELSKEVLRYAAGLPLTIKTLSSSLRTHPTYVWKDAIKRLEKIPWGDTLKILKISYDALEKDHQDIFLHVACLLKGVEKKEAIRILESLGFRAQFGLEVLEQKSLITFRDDYHEELDMHDHLEEMGMHIVRSSDTDKLLWNKDEIENILEKDMGTEAIRGIKLLNSMVHQAKISQSLRKMSKLCFLYVEWWRSESYKFDEAGEYLPNSLQYLNWVKYPYRDLPKTFQADNLVEIQMSRSNIRQLWEGGEKKVLPKLRFLDLSCSEKLETFDSVMTPNLEELILRTCKKLVEFNISGECSHLKKLDLSYSSALEKLTIPNECRNLEELHLHGCKSLRELQMHGECLSCLKSLDSSRTKLRSFNLGLTPNLEVLQLEECEDFEEIYVPVAARLRLLSFFSYNGIKPGAFSYLEKLKSLEELRFSFTSMNRLPDSICMLKHLIVLNLKWCQKLEQLPEDLDRLECLEELILSCCYALGNIPDCICNMTRLKTLDLSHCDKLEKLPDKFTRLQNLELLNIRGIAGRLKNLPESISQFKDLVVIKK